MAKTDFKNVDEYLKAQPPVARRVLKEVRAALKRAVPGAEEVISYQIPTLKLGGRVVIYFSAWKEHYSLYPAMGVVEALGKTALARAEIEKGTIRFRYEDGVPRGLITRIGKVRAKLAKKKS